MELIAVGAAARDIWREVLPTDSSAVISQTPIWMDCVCESGRYADATRAYRTADGRQLVLPLARLRGVPASASVASSMPFGWGTGGLVSADGRLSADDVAAVVADLEAQRTLRVTIRPGPATEDAWAAGVPGDVVRAPHMTQTLDLSGGFDDVWRRRCKDRVRRWARKAERLQVSAEWDDTGRLVGVLDALYRKSVTRWARQQHEPLALARWRARRRDPRRKFETVAERLGPACRVWVAWRSGEPVAALVVLTHGEHSTVWRGAMDKELAAGTGANELLHRLAIEEACQAGRRFFHLGDSAPSSPLAHNKSGYGAEEKSYTSYSFERLPLTAADRFMRRQIKRVIGFRD